MAAAAASRSASAKTMLGLLPPSSRVTGLRRAAPRRPGEDDLRHARVLHERVARDRSVPRQDLEQSLRKTRLQGQSGQPQGRQRGGLGGLEEDRVARGQRRCGAPGRDGHREVPGGDDADHAERFEERHVQAAGDRDLPPGEALDSPGGVVEQVADVAGLPAGVAEGVAGLRDLQPGQLLQVVVDGGGEAAQQPGAVAGGEGGPGGLRPRGPRDGGVHVGRGDGGDGGDDLFGGGVQYAECGWLVGEFPCLGQSVPHMRSKERRSSQSVTAAS